MSKRISAFAAATAALVAVAIGWQALGASDGEEDKDPLPPTASTETPTADPPEEEKTDDGDREGFTADHTGKPGESKS